jgi:hypothetical protein
MAGRRKWKWAGIYAGMALAMTLSVQPAGALTIGGRGPQGSGNGSGQSSGPTSYQPKVHSAAYANPGVLNYGDAVFYGAPTNVSVPSPVVAMAPSAGGLGYWVVTADGRVYQYGNAVNYGGVNFVNIYAPVVSMASTPDGKGYWLVALDGGVFSFGDAEYYGSTGGVRLAQPIVGIAPTPDGQGYWLAASDGGVFNFGDAPFRGSLGNVKLASPIVGIAAAPTGYGYTMVGGDGGAFTFGSAKFRGSLGGQSFPGWIDGIAADGSGDGYWMADANGSVYHFGDAGSYGDDSSAPRNPPIAQIVASNDSKGYWLLEPDAFPTSFVHPQGNYPIVTLASSQVQGDPYTGYFCNPYGPCEAWCALFATWVWNHSGVNIPNYAFVGSVYDWARAYTAVLSPSQRPSPGDAVLYGTGPQNIYTAVHMGIVAQVWPDGAIDTVEGDSGPAPTGYLNVTINGPYLPGDSQTYNGMPIFAYALP